MLTQERKWWFRQRAGIAVEALRRNRFEAEFCDDQAAALDHILNMVPPGALVGFGDSLTLREIGLFEALEHHGCRLVNPPAVQDGLSPEEKRTLRFGCFTSDVYICSANAITLDGKVVNVDGIGNRVAPTIFGPPRVIIVAGANKLVTDLDAALARIRDEAAPLHAFRDGYNTPCAQTGTCQDCRGSAWMCRATVILNGPTKQTSTTVVLVGEHLGL
ncbi:MAG: lactate utilization protein [Chloroflexi bacterium]|nr:lactate utilization protein [Chloroflexota bacterium]